LEENLLQEAKKADCYTPEDLKSRFEALNEVRAALSKPQGAQTRANARLFHGDAARDVLKAHSKDMSFHAASMPQAVLFPITPEEVAAVVKICAAASVPIVPRGAGSGLEGGAIPYQGGIVLDLMRMKGRVLHPAELHVQVITTAPTLNHSRPSILGMSRSLKSLTNKVLKD